ncbi:MAG: hypothetical protein Q9219_005300 [cf. Caloplaca sp. 3 TL-2023]
MECRTIYSSAPSRERWDGSAKCEEEAGLQKFDMNPYSAAEAGLLSILSNLVRDHGKDLKNLQGKPGEILTASRKLFDWGPDSRYFIVLAWSGAQIEEAVALAIELLTGG